MSDFFTPPSPMSKHCRTEHAVAVKCRERGWAGHATRAEWESGLRFKGKFSLPENEVCETVHGKDPDNGTESESQK